MTLKFSFAALRKVVRMRIPSQLLILLLLAGCESTDPYTFQDPSPYKSRIQPPEQAEPISKKLDASPLTSRPPSETTDGRVKPASFVLSKPNVVASASVTALDSNPPDSATVSPASPAPAKLAAASSEIYTFTQALNRSLLTNPDLVALRGTLSINTAMVGVAETYPWNPFVQAEYFPRGSPFVANTPGQAASGAGYSNYYVWAMQRFELAHQTRHRTNSAQATMNQVQWNIFQAELLNVAQTSRLYFTALYQKEIFELARETVQLNDRLLDAVEKRFKANQAKAADITAAKVAARQSRRQSELADNTYQAALLALRQQMNLPMNTPLDLPEKLSAIKWLGVRTDPRSMDDKALAMELVEGRPDVMAAQAGIKISQANLGLARAARIPDVQAGPIYQTADDTTKYLGFRLQMDIPVWNSGAPLVRQREAEMAQQNLNYEQLKVRASLEAEAAIDQYERVREMLAKAASSKSDAMPAELKEITSLFEAGQADIIAVLTTQTNLLQEQRVYLDLLNQLAQAAAAVIQATGLPTNAIVGGAKPMSR